MQMATMGAAICMDQAMDCNWVKVIYLAAMVTMWCNDNKIGGGSGHVAHKHHNILPQIHTERPCQHFINLSKIQIMAINTSWE